MEPKATIQLDEKELTLLIQAVIKRSKQVWKHGDDVVSREYLELADKLADTQEKLFSDLHELKIGQKE